jgi:two-component system, NarL family, sensor histidine kinase DegS
MIKIHVRYLPKRYLSALRSHLFTGRRNRDAARELGQLGAESGIETLALARMHENALAGLALSVDLSCTSSRMIKRAETFFSNTLIPIEDGHRSGREQCNRLKTAADTLRAHAAELTAGDRKLRREVDRRKTGERAFGKVKERYFRLFTHSQFMQKKLHHLARRVLAAQEDERREISRELHDGVVQTLVGINVELAALASGASTGVTSMKSKIAHTQKLVERSVGAVHLFARELRPASLDDLGLLPTLLAFMKTLAARKKWKIRPTAFGGVEKLDEVRRTVLYRVAQESLTNVSRHAEATIVSVTIAAITGGIRLEIKDNGKSFQVHQALSSTANKRLGLLGMRERVEMVGGAFNVESSAEKGTTVRAEVPF